jgi:hypothetical protein
MVWGERQTYELKQIILYECALKEALEVIIITKKEK